MKILHLSDIHFGINNSIYERKDPYEKKKDILNELIDFISNLNEEEKPKHILFTGDIAWQGTKEEFNEAQKWFEKLLSTLKLTGKDISFCVGNHDVYHKFGNFQNIFKKINVREIDNAYKYENIYMYETTLEYYEQFCENLKVEPYIFLADNKRNYSYSVGYKLIRNENEEILLTSFNTSLLSYMTKTIDEDKMWIGLEQVKSLIENGILPRNDLFSISIFHHPIRYLSSSETSSYENRIATLPYLMKNVDLILCGHTETGDKPILYKQDSGGSMITGGATYYSDNHPNSFSIVNIKDVDDFEVCSYLYDVIWKKFTEPTISTMHGNKYIESEKTIFSNCKLVFKYNDKRRETNLKTMIKETNPDFHLVMSNKKQVTRNLDISIKCDSSSNVEFDTILAKKKRYVVKAILERERLFKSINEFSASSDASKIIWLEDADGRKLIRANNLSGESVYDKQTINMLEELSMIENHFGVKFICPEDVYEIDNKYRQELVQFIKLGYSKLSSKKGKSFNYLISDVESLKTIYSQMHQNNSAYLYHKIKKLPDLYGTELCEEEMAFICGKYSVDLNELENKINTFLSGDIRMVGFNVISTDTYVIKSKCLEKFEQTIDENIFEIHINSE